MEKNIMKRFLTFLVTAIVIFYAAAATAQSKPPLRLLQTIPLPDLKAGDFDHFAVDLAGNRLFLTGEANNSVLVLDIRTNKLIHTIADVDEPHSMLYLPAAKQLWVVNGGDGTLKIFDSTTYALIESMKVTEGADSSAYDPAKHLLYIAAGGSDAKMALTLKIFDSTTYALIESMKVTEGADSSAYDPAKHLLYIAAGGSDAKMAFTLINIINTSTRKKVGDIKVDSTNIEAMA